MPICFPAHLDVLFSSLTDSVLKDLPSFLSCFLVQSCLPRIPPRSFLSTLKGTYLKSRVITLLHFFCQSPQDPELHCFKVNTHQPIFPCLWIAEPAMCPTLLAHPVLLSSSEICYIIIPEETREVKEPVPVIQRVPGTVLPLCFLWNIFYLNKLTESSLATG